MNNDRERWSGAERKTRRTSEERVGDNGKEGLETVGKKAKAGLWGKDIAVNTVERERVMERTAN